MSSFHTLNPIINKFNTAITIFPKDGVDDILIRNIFQKYFSQGMDFCT